MQDLTPDRLKLSDDLLDASGRCAAALKLSRAAYIRRAVERDPDA